MSKSTTKTCTKCDTTYPATTEFFTRHKAKPDGLYGWCKTCKRAQEKKQRDADPERDRQDSRDYAAAHRKEAIERATDWYEENKDHKKSYDQEYNKKPEVIARKKQRAKERAPELRAQRKAWNKANPEKAAKTKRVSVRNRRARLANVEGTHNARDIDRLYTEQEGRCFYCGITLFDDYHVDHITPVSRGGANSSDNLAITCSECNQNKSDKTVEEWQMVRGW